MLNLSRTMTGWRHAAVLAGMLTLAATNVASASPRHGRRAQPPQQCTACVTAGPQKCGLHAPGQRASRQYRRGYAAGKQAGWQAGYADGRNGYAYAGYAKHRLRGRHYRYQVGFRAGYAQSYAQGYRRGRADARPRRRCGVWWNWNW